jgi:hypothetical protein
VGWLKSCQYLRNFTKKYCIIVLVDDLPDWLTTKRVGAVRRLRSELRELGEWASPLIQQDIMVSLGTKIEYTPAGGG